MNDKRKPGDTNPPKTNSDGSRLEADAAQQETVDLPFPVLGPESTNQETIELPAIEDPYATTDPNETVEIAAPADESFDPYATDDASATVFPSVNKPESTAPSVKTDTIQTNAKQEETTPAAQATQGPKVSTGQSTIIPGAGSTSTLIPEPSLVSGTTEESSNTATGLDKTVAMADIDQTIQLDSGAVSHQDQTVQLETTTVGENSEKQSVLNDTNVTQTINPRELSEEDAAFWGSISRGSANVSHQSQRSPAINRSLSETKLNLRDQIITDVRSEEARHADYRMVRLLGKGGMGNVYVARQGSLDRLVALKVIKPLDEEKQRRLKQKGTLEQVENDRRLQFISEAVVTGDLDHPNIVPIHDIAVTGDNTLFYSMKRVSGTPWSKVIDEKSRDENIDILLKVCDAIGFAHTRGVVHRDIKPENIMLGEFGVVMVMDWGLALAKPEFEKIDSVHPTTGLGGSPAYMAPEMAIGPVDRIGPASDIYLLGATLFQIIAGAAPHFASNVSECLKAVAANKIREVPAEKQGELLQIALKAMATRPEDRYATVRDFQESIRSYRSHSESIALASRAQEELIRAETSSSYDDYSRAMFGFEESLMLWGQNEKAIAGLAAAKLAYANEAYRKGDFDLGLSLLDQSDTTHQSLIEQLEKGKKERLAKTARIALLRKATAAMLAFIFIGGGAALYAIDRQRTAAEVARETAEVETAKAKKAAFDEAIAKKAAETARETALIEKMNAEDEKRKAEAERKTAAEQKDIAERQKNIATFEKGEADKARDEALRLQGIADDARTKAEFARADALYSNYIAQVGLAHAYIDQNNFERAREILLQLKQDAGDSPLAWEWRWLWKQTSQAIDFVATAAPAMSLDLSSMPNRIRAVLENGEVQSLSFSEPLQLDEPSAAIAFGDGLASATVFSQSQRTCFAGTRSGDIYAQSEDPSKELAVWTAHATSVNRLLMLDDQVLISASDDRTIRLWDPVGHKELATCWNIGPVKDISIVRSGDSWTMLAAIAESKFGRVTVWNLSDENGQWKAKQIGDFLQHQSPVLSVSLSPLGDLAASGDALGHVLVWSTKDLKPTDYESKVSDAIRKLKNPAVPSTKPDNTTPIKYTSLMDRDLSTQTKLPQTMVAHSDRVRVVRFSPDGKRLLTGAEDYVLRVWDVASTALIEKLRGHGGWVVDAQFLDSQGLSLLSASNDGTIRVWSTASYVNAAVPSNLATKTPEALHDEEILSARLNHAGNAIVSASRDRKAIISRIDPITMKTQRLVELSDELDPVALKEGSTFVAQSFALDIDHARLYVGSADSTVRAWDLDRGTELFEIAGTGLNTSIAISKDGRYLLTRSSNDDAKTLLWRIDPTKPVVPTSPKKLMGHHPDASVTAFAISPDGSRVFTADNLGSGYLWDGRTGKPLAERIDVARGYRINDAAFINDGKEILIASDNQLVMRLDVHKGTTISYAHPGIVTQFTVSPDEQRMVCMSESIGKELSQIEVACWNLGDQSKQVMEQFALPLESKKTAGKGSEIASKARISSLEFGTDGRTVVISRQPERNQPSRIVIWRIDEQGLPTVQNAFEIPANLGAVEAAIPLATEQVLTLNGDAAFRWSTSEKAQLMSYRANAAVHHANFSFDDKYVITGSQSVKIWDTTSHLSVAKVERPHDSPLTCVEFTPRMGSYQFATGAKDGFVRLFEFDPVNRTTNEIQSWEVNEDNLPIRSVRFSPDGSRLFAVGDRGTAKLISLDPKVATVDYSMNNAGDFLSAAFSPDASLILVGGTDAKVRLWKVVDATEAVSTPKVLEGHSDQVEDVKALSANGGPLRIFSASRDKSIKVWDPRLNVNEALPREVLNLREHQLGVTSVDATDNGNVVISAGRDATLIVWPASDTTELNDPR